MKNVKFNFHINKVFFILYFLFSDNLYGMLRGTNYSVPQKKVILSDAQRDAIKNVFSGSASVMIDSEQNKDNNIYKKEFEEDKAIYKKKYEELTKKLTFTQQMLDEANSRNTTNVNFTNDENAMHIITAIGEMNSEEIRKNKDAILALDPGKFVGLITRSFKNSIIKRTIHNKDKYLSLAFPDTLPISDEMSSILLSPNNQLIISKMANAKNYQRANAKNYQANYLVLWKINENKNSPQILGSLEAQQGIHAIAFSSDSKKLAVGYQENENKLVVYKIKSGNILDTDPQILLGHTAPIQAIAFHPSGKSIVSASIDHNLSNNIFLWTINSDDTIQKKPIALAMDKTDLVDIHTLSFSDDGTSLLCGGQARQATKKALIAWGFDKDGNITNTDLKQYKIEVSGDISFTMNDVTNVSFIGKSKKFAVYSDGIKSTFKRNIIVGEIVGDILTSKSIFDLNFLGDEENDLYIESLLVSPNGEMIVVTPSKKDYPFLLLAIDNTDNSEVISRINNSQEKVIAFSNDSNKILSHNDHNIFIRTLLNKSQQKVVATLKNLNTYKLLLIAKELDVKVVLEPVNNILAQEGVPSEVIQLLKTLKYTPQKKHFKNNESAKKTSLEVTSGFKGLVNWAINFFWAASKTITPKE